MRKNGNCGDPRGDIRLYTRDLIRDVAEGEDKTRNPLQCAAKYVLRGELDLSRVSTFRSQLVPAGDIRRGEVDFPRRKEKERGAAVTRLTVKNSRGGGCIFLSLSLSPFLPPLPRGPEETGGVRGGNPRHPRRSDSAARERSVFGLI